MTTRLQSWTLSAETKMDDVIGRGFRAGPVERQKLGAVLTGDGFQLSFNDVVRFVGFPLFQLLSDTSDDFKTFCERVLYLRRNQLPERSDELMSISLFRLTGVLVPHPILQRHGVSQSDRGWPKQHPRPEPLQHYISQC